MMAQKGKQAGAYQAAGVLAPAKLINLMRRTDASVRSPRHILYKEKAEARLALLSACFKERGAQP